MVGAQVVAKMIEDGVTANQAVLKPMPAVPKEEQARAGVYALVGGLLAAPPSPAIFSFLEQVDDSESTLPWQALKRVALATDAEQFAQDYHTLFIGLGRGELLPYGSVYLTGFLQEQPLADLREDLARLGLERSVEMHEPEDHAGALCEAMSLMVAAPAEYPLATQQAFFERHLGPWMAEFFDDLVTARDSGFYRVVGEFGKAFIEMEKQYFSMEA